MVMAGVLALALLVGGGFLAWSLLRGATPAAAKGIPSNALAVFEVNLNPSAGDKLAVKELAAKFPFLKDEANDAGDDYKKAFWSMLAKMGKNAPRGPAREEFRKQARTQLVRPLRPGHQQGLRQGVRRQTHQGP